MFRDWRGLLSRLAREAADAQWRGPLVIDELPYLVGTSPELPSVLQSWVDHEAREAGLLKGNARSRVERRGLDPLGPLHREPDQLLLEEIPSALDVRPVLDAIGAGAHRVSEIGGRVGRPATSMARPLDRLLGLGPARREVPFGEPEKTSRRSVYKIDDPFFRLWFRVVAPHRAQLASGSRPVRAALLSRYWKGLVAQAWEDICRAGLPRVASASALGRLGPWGAASRWWKGNAPEWDVVSESIDGRRLLLGEAKWGARRLSPREVERLTRALVARTPPPLPGRFSNHELVKVLFVPEVGPGVSRRAPGEVMVVTGSDLLR